jgi:hypothetical protein
MYHVLWDEEDCILATQYMHMLRMITRSNMYIIVTCRAVTVQRPQDEYMYQKRF